MDHWAGCFVAAALAGRPLAACARSRAVASRCSSAPPTVQLGKCVQIVAGSGAAAHRLALRRGHAFLGTSICWHARPASGLAGSRARGALHKPAGGSLLPLGDATGRVVMRAGLRPGMRDRSLDPDSVDKEPYGVGEGTGGWLEVEPGYAVWVERLDPKGNRLGGVRAPIIKKKESTAPLPTLVLDLDETMVHSFADETRDGRRYDHTFLMRRGGSGNQFQVYVKKRPHLDEFLREASRLFELITFTASGAAYAEPVFDFLESEEKFFAHRLYNPATVYIRGSYVKDLVILGRDLARTVIIDNSPQWFGFQLDNGIPIRSYYGEKEDASLLELLPFLRELAEAEDMRPLVRKRFPLYKNPAAAKLRLADKADNPLNRKDPPPPHGV